MITNFKIYEIKTDDKYLWTNDNGEKYYHICNFCDSNKLKQHDISVNYYCDNCGEISVMPMWVTPEEYEDMLIKRETEKYNI